MKYSIFFLLCMTTLLLLMLIREPKNIRIAAKACTEVTWASLTPWRKNYPPPQPSKHTKWFIVWLKPHTDIMWWHEIQKATVLSWQPPHGKASYMRKASVAMTPHVWKAWWKSASSGYFTAASMMIHHPVKNCNKHKAPARTRTSDVERGGKNPEALHLVTASA